MFGRVFVGYAFAEGWAHYSEEMMRVAGLGESAVDERIEVLEPRAAFHHHRLAEAGDLVAEWATACGLDPAWARDVATRAVIAPGDWVGELESALDTGAEWVLDLGPGDLASLLADYEATARGVGGRRGGAGTRGAAGGAAPDRAGDGDRGDLAPAILAYEFMNEPDFVIEEWERDLSSHVPRPVPFEVMADIVSRLSGVVHREHPGAMTTIGCARVHNLWAWDDDALGLDLLQVRELYAGELTYIDAWIGRLLNELVPIGKSRNYVKVWFKEYLEGVKQEVVIIRENDARTFHDNSSFPQSLRAYS